MWIVFLDTSPTFSDSFAAAKELGAKVLHLSSKDNPTQLTGKIGPTKWAKIESWEPDVLLEIIRREIAQGEPTAVWALNERLLPLAAQLNESLGSQANRPSLRTIWSTKSKLLLRQKLEGTQLNPRYAVMPGSGPIKHPFPGIACVIKPFEGDSSIGVELLGADASEQDFVAAARRSLTVLETIATVVKGYRPEFVPSGINSLLVEEYVGGREYSVEIFLTDNHAHVMGICGKSPMAAPYFEEISYTMPALIDSTTKSRLETAALKAVRAIGLTSGMAHVELKDGTDGPKILDIGLRFGGGGLTHDLIQTAYGINMVKAVLAELVGIPALSFLAPTKEDTALLFLLQVGAGGVIESLPSPEGVDGLPRAVRFGSFVAVGHTLTPYPAYSGTPGFVLFSIAGRDSATRDRAKEIVNNCLASLTFSYQDQGVVG